MRRFWIAPLFALAVITVGCGSKSQSTSVSSILARITVTAQSTSIVVGQSEQISAMGLFGNGNTQTLTSSVSWKSSNTALATITSSGMLTATASGQVTVTAASQGV